MRLAFLKNASIFACHKSFHISNNVPSLITIHLYNLKASSSGLEISYHSIKVVNVLLKPSGFSMYHQV
jgi:hypothetical protein